MNIIDPRPLIEKPAYDVIVVGGGIAGAAAAVAAARNGAKTLLMEKQINLGGLATVGLISWYEPLCDGMGRQVIGGLAEELIRLSIRDGMENLPAKWGGEGKNHIHYDRYATNFSPTIFALELDAWVRESGADIRFDTRVTYPVVENGRITGIIAESVSGRELYPCRFAIDASGDATLCAAAGLPTVVGMNYLNYTVQGYSRKDILEYVETGDDCRLRHWIGCGGSLTGEGQPADRKPHTTYTSDSENEFIAWGKDAMLRRYQASDKHEREIMTLPGMPQYRKIRHLVGETVFTGEETGCPDSIGTCGDFRKRGPVYSLPYRALYTRAIPNLMTAGRIISADGEGWEIIRVIPVCALTGQAAGTAAALCSRSGDTFDTLSLSQLQNTLKAQGVLF